MNFGCIRPKHLTVNVDEHNNIAIFVVYQNGNVASFCLFKHGSFKTFSFSRRSEVYDGTCSKITLKNSGVTAGWYKTNLILLYENGLLYVFPAL